ncbi:ankyrin repeat domain-containing protein [Aspergillus mulundensis]|uniref:Ankyrin repeat protein n=1 Tax=Aspergillus mulundensis TaxID=1810919 RepID=A0A3D8SCL5_9EURO|nr:hypothetical protein DSM5745_04418 [Aspergillus mulundensis]RDW84092.1 hypothetical protein DSM5745_04418 [Aspergillus mulundensis]
MAEHSTRLEISESAGSLRLSRELIDMIISQCAPNLDPSIFTVAKGNYYIEELLPFHPQKGWKRAGADLRWFLSLRLVNRKFDTSVLRRLTHLLRTHLEAAATYAAAPEFTDDTGLPQTLFEWFPPSPSTLALAVRLLDVSLKPSKAAVSASAYVTKVVETPVRLFSRSAEEAVDGKNIGIDRGDFRAPYREGLLAILAAILPTEQIFQLITGKGDEKKGDDDFGLPDSLNGALMTAAYLGRLDHIKLLLDLGLAVHLSWGPSLLAAALGGHLDVLEFLKDKDVDLNARHGPLQYSALHFAAIGGHVNAIEFLINHGVNPDVANSTKQKAPDFAAAGGHLNAVKCLLHNKRAGQATRYWYSENRLSIDWAIRRGHDKVVEKIIQHTRMGTNLLYLWEYFGGRRQYSPFAATALYGQGRIFHLLKNAYRMFERLEDTNELFKLALEGGNASIWRGWGYDLPFILATAHGHESLTRYLLGHRDETAGNRDETTVNYFWEGNDTPLLLAIRSGDLGTVKALLEYPAIDVNYPSGDHDYGAHPLHFAVSEHCRNPEIVRALLGHRNINPNPTNEEGRTPLGELLAAMRNGDFKPNYATLIELVKIFTADERVEKDVVDREGSSPLLDAAASSIHAFKELLPFYRKSHVWWQNSAGWSTLELAVVFGELDIVAILLEPKLGVPEELLQYVIERAQYYHDQEENMIKAVKMVSARLQAMKDSL